VAYSYDYGPNVGKLDKNVQNRRLIYSQDQNQYHNQKRKDEIHNPVLQNRNQQSVQE